MENQVLALKAKGVPSEFLSSQRTEKDRAKILADIQSQKPSIKLLYVTPELLSTVRYDVADEPLLVGLAQFVCMKVYKYHIVFLSACGNVPARVDVWLQPCIACAALWRY